MLKVNEIIAPLQAEVLAAGEMEAELTGGYCGDLLSDVMGNAHDGSVWITIQSHPNVIAVATLVGIPCVVITNWAEVENDTLERARAEKITVIRTHFTSYQAVSVLSGLGIPGTKRDG
ncbi:MAG: hypothetical protein PWP04_506 [Candidatus Atribacteria bacterium]|nr:hypothetical protein [Candidatus Atribacteria bacterium]